MILQEQEHTAFLAGRNYSSGKGPTTVALAEKQKRQQLTIRGHLQNRILTWVIKMLSSFLQKELGIGTLKSPLLELRVGSNLKKS